MTSVHDFIGKKVRVTVYNSSKQGDLVASVVGTLEENPQGEFMVAQDGIEAIMESYCNFSQDQVTLIATRGRYYAAKISIKV